MGLNSQFLSSDPLKSSVLPFSTATAPGYSALADNYDVSFYFIDLEVSNQTNFIRGSATVNARRISEHLDTFAIELDANLEIDSVFIQNKKAGNFERDGDVVKIPLNSSDIYSEEFRLKIYYNGYAGSGGYFSGLSNAIAYPWERKITYTLSEPFQASDWFPAKQNLGDKADSSWVFITTDSGLMAGSNGLLRNVEILENGRKRFEWKSNFPVAYYLISFSVGDYIDYSFYAPLNDSDSVLVQNYLYNYPGLLDSLKNVIDYTAPLLKLFSEKFGTYPFIREKYGHCMAPMGGGMEHQTMTTISGFNFGIIAHELAHQWFGDYLTCGSWQDIWINEGFASYAEYIAAEGLQSRAEAIKWLAQAHTFAINYPNGGVYLDAEESRSVQRIFNSALSYKKGGAIIHMLRYEINDDSLFFEIIRDYIRTFANNVATGKDFKKVVEKHTGENFSWFFDQWYYGKGYPVFVTNWRQIGDSLILTGSESSSTGDNSFFKTHMDYRIHYQDGNFDDIRVNYDEPDKVFRYSVSGEIQSVQIDVNSNVLKNSVIYKYTDLSKIFTANPNPFKDELNLSFRNSIMIRDIKLYGINGKIYYKQTTSNGSIAIDMSHLKPGIYLLSVIEGGVKYTEKLMKY